MKTYEPQNPDYEAFVRSALKQQGFMRLLGAELRAIEPGRVVLGVAYRDDLNQQNGFLHGGVIGTLCDNAAAAAAGQLCRKGGNGLLRLRAQRHRVARGRFRN